MRILAATDQSKHSDLAIEFLKRLPCHDSLELTIATVTPATPLYDLTGVVHSADMPNSFRQQQQSTQATLIESAAFLRSWFRSVTTRIATGSPGLTICQLAKDFNFELITTGAIGRSAIARVLLGSTSDYIATHAECSVLVVRPMAAPAPTQISVDSPPRRVLLSVGNAKSDERLWQWIDSLELPNSTEIRIVHVMDALPSHQLNVLAKASAYRNEVNKSAAIHIEDLKPRLESRGHKVESELLESPHVGQALSAYIATERCDLAILGNQRKENSDRIHLGSTSRYVLRHAQCSVLITRA